MSLFWANLLHFYQPPNQKREILEKIISESYQKIIQILEDTPWAKISLNISGSLTELLAKEGFLNILNRIKSLAERGQIELVSTACYHPILPLLPKREVIRQVKLNEAINQKYFKKAWRPRPKGFFLPEMAYSKKTARIIESLNYQWLALDEIAYSGNFGQNRFDKLYQIKDLKIKAIFRNKGLSDIFFTGWLNCQEKFFEALKNDGRSNKFLITAFDGENLGHHQKKMAEIWAQLIKRKDIQTLTFSELIKKYDQIEEVEPLPSSWSSRPEEIKNGISYSLWLHPQNKIHQLQWHLTNFVIKNINHNQKDSNYKKARKELDKALFSCQYFWASASPWWSLKMIKGGAERLFSSLAFLKKLDSKILRQAELLKEKIIAQSEIWQNQGRVEKIKKAYLSKEPLGRYWGGKKIN